MKTLTVFSAIILPLTLIVGIYGMNFEMVEFKWKYGELFAWGLMAAVATVIGIYFKRKKWF